MSFVVSYGIYPILIQKINFNLMFRYLKLWIPLKNWSLPQGPQYKVIPYLVILTCSFKWQLLGYFSLICYPAHIDSLRDFISHILKYLFFTYLYKRNDATVTYFLKFMSITFSKFIYSLLL